MTDTVKALTDEGTQHLIDLIKAYEVEHIAYGAVTTDAISNGAVTGEKIADGAITIDAIGDVVDSAGGIASFASVCAVLRDMAIMRYNIDFNAIVADQEMSTIYIWEFNEDTNLEVGYWDDSNSKFWCYSGMGAA